MCYNWAEFRKEQAEKGEPGGSTDDSCGSFVWRRDCPTLQTGVTAWLQFGDARVAIDSEAWTIQEPSVGALLGVSFERH